MFNKILIFLISIAIIARFIGLDYVPPHLSNDEIGAAYDAYSISKTLKDEHNQFLPILFQSHGIYRSALAVYFTIPSIMIFGNSDFAARLPSAILGSLTIIILSLLVLKLTQNKRLALLTGLFLAFSPWHFSASRATLESNYALFLLVTGIYLFFIGLLHRKTWATIASFIFFALSIYGYYTEWGLTPLIILSLIYLYRKETLHRKVYFIAFIIFGILLIPLGNDFLHHLGSSRASTDFIHKDISVGRLLEQSQFNIFQKGQIILKAILDKYSVYTSLGYIFFYGAKFLSSDNPYQVGLLSSPLVVCFVFGLFNLKRIFKQHTPFIYSWLLLSPLVPAMSQGDINNVRGLPILIPLVIITAVGSLFVLNFIQKKLILRILTICCILISLLYFALIYFYHFPIQSAESYEYGFKQMALYTKVHGSRYEKIIIDPRFGDKQFYYWGVPHVYIPFYLQIDPHVVQTGFRTAQTFNFDKYEFRVVDWPQERLQKNYLYIVPFDNTPTESQLKELQQIYDITLPNRKIQFKLYSTINT